MKKPFDRRSFMKIAGASFGIGVAYSAFPTAALGGEAGEMFHFRLRHVLLQGWTG